MYRSAAFTESRLGVLHELMKACPLAAVVAIRPHGLDAEHLPLLLDESRGKYGVLRGHVARANPMWQEVAEGADVLALFRGPQHYISPTWYPSAPEHGKAVPTWNYIVVHARGHITWYHDRAWLRELVEKLTFVHERARPLPWRLADAPDEYSQHMLSSIVGFEIPIAELIGKWKLNQNRSPRDRAGVIAGLKEEGSEAAAEMAEQMQLLP